MASIPNFFDDDDVQSLYDNPCQLDTDSMVVEGTEPTLFEFTESEPSPRRRRGDMLTTCLMPGSNITLTSLNTDTDSEREYNFFSLDFEIEGHSSCESNLINTETLPEEQTNLNLQRSFGGQSPMSCTASMSGSEPRSPASSHNSDDSGDDLLEYLLKDASITVEPSLPKPKVGMGDPATELSNSISSRTRQQRQTRSSSDAIRGVDKLKGPWGNTKMRNTSISKNAIMARENRLRKKMYIQNLMDTNKQLTDENAILKKEAGTVNKKISSMEEEIKYLHKVLFNQSALAGLLKKFDQREVQLNTSHLGDETEEAGSPSCSGGVCLHVNGTNATLKMCARCARDDQP